MAPVHVASLFFVEKIRKGLLCQDKCFRFYKKAGLKLMLSIVLFSNTNI